MAKEKTKKKKGGGIKNVAATIALRLSLLRIWLVKNLTLFLTTIMIAVLVVIATGCGKNLPLIGMLFDGKEYWNAGNSFWENVLGVLGGLVTPIAACVVIITKTKRITLNDIKSVKTKRAMIKAGLYFDKNGKLAKRKKDKPVKEPGFISKTLAPVKEFVLAVTATVKDIDDEEVEKQVKDESVDIGLKDFEEALSEPTIIESVAPTLVTTTEKLQEIIPTKSVEIEESEGGFETIVSEQPVEEVKSEVVTEEIADEPGIEDSSVVEENTTVTNDTQTDEIDDEDSEEDKGGIIIGAIAGITTAVIAIGAFFKRLFTRTEEQKAAAAERKAARAAAKLERQKKKEAAKQKAAEDKNMKKALKAAKKVKEVVEKAKEEKVVKQTENTSVQNTPTTTVTRRTPTAAAPTTTTTPTTATIRRRR